MSKRIVVMSQLKFMLVLFVSMSLSSVAAVALSATVMLDMIDDAKFAVAISEILWVAIWVIIVELAILASVYIVNAIRLPIMALWSRLTDSRRR